MNRAVVKVYRYDRRVAYVPLVLAPFAVFFIVAQEWLIAVIFTFIWGLASTLLRREIRFRRLEDDGETLRLYNGKDMLEMEAPWENVRGFCPFDGESGVFIRTRYGLMDVTRLQPASELERRVEEELRLRATDES